MPDAPSHVRTNEHALAEWNRVVPLLCAAKILTVADLGMIEGYCLAQGHAVEAELRVQAEGIVVEEEHPGTETREGHFVLKKHPAVTVLLDCLRTLRSLGSEFGLSPASRSRIASGGEPAGERDERKAKYFRR